MIVKVIEERLEYLKEKIEDLELIETGVKKFRKGGNNRKKKKRRNK